MEALFQSGRIVDLIIGLMMIETAALIAYRSFSGRGIATAVLLANMAAGVCLLLALRAALTGTNWTWVAIAVAIALPLHLLDMRGRWNA
jgi:hypothetical protein